MASDLRDDETIGKDEILWRRLYPREGQFRDWYKNVGSEWRPSSLAFLDNRSPTHSVSAYIASETELDRLRDDYPQDNIAAIPTSVPRAFNHTIQRVPEAGYNSHVHITPPSNIWGPENRFKSRRKEAARAMARAATWVYIRE